MAFDLWLIYAGACLGMLLLPGPTVLLVIGYALSAGRRSGLWTLPAVMVGDALAITLSLTGLGAVLAMSALAFTLLKWVGAAYLVWLGLQLWRAPVPDAPAPAEPPHGSRGRAMALHAVTVTALNPKGIAFFVAFLPQFVVPTSPPLPQMMLLATTFLVMAMVTNLGYVLLAGRAGEAACSPRIRRGINRIGGSCLIAAGAITAAVSRDI